VEDQRRVQRVRDPLKIIKVGRDNDVTPSRRPNDDGRIDNVPCACARTSDARGTRAWLVEIFDAAATQ
jgi:hypothetical protein